jgi:putative SOS response-associated peptidase YedK
MCGRFTLTCDAEALREEFANVEIPELPGPRYNIAPQQPVLAITGPDASEPRAGFLEWGLVPFWMEESPGKRLVNVRAESLAGRFRHQFERRRCLIPADSFYEWQREGGRKVPMRILRPDRRPFALAGIWDRWQTPEGEPMYTCAIITTAARGVAGEFHDRMPLIIDAPARALWLNREASPGEVRKLLKPYSGELEAYQVSTVVNSARNDDPRCVEPV